MSLKSFFKKVSLKTQDKQKPSYLCEVQTTNDLQPLFHIKSFLKKSFLKGATCWSNFNKLYMLEIFVLRNIMVFVACRNSTCFQKLNIIVYCLTCSYSICFLKMCDNTFENMRSQDIHIRRCEWSHGCKMTQSKSRIKNSKYFYMYAALLL